MSLKKIILLVTFLPALAVAQLSKQFPMVPGVPIVHSPKSSGKYIGTPSIVKMPGGDFIASHDFSDLPVSLISFTYTAPPIKEKTGTSCQK